MGRVWCAGRPFMIYGEITQKISLFLFPRQLSNGGRENKLRNGPAGFVWAIYPDFFMGGTRDLENTAYLSACLLLLITAGAMIFSAIFELRFCVDISVPLAG